jgi:hypothetical protein
MRFLKNQLKFLVVLSVLVLGVMNPVLLQAQTTPNFLIFFVDDQGWTDLGSFGSLFYETPNIDSCDRFGEVHQRLRNLYRLFAIPGQPDDR